jgi:hypothetical protein
MAESRVTTVVAEVPSTGGEPDARVTTVVAEVLNTGGVPHARVTALVAEVLHGPRGADRGRHRAQAHRGRGRGVNSTAAATNTSALFGIYRWGWGFSTSQDFNGDLALIACFASSWTPPWCGAGTPIRSASCAHGTSCLRSWGARHPPRLPRPARAWSPS